MTVKSKLTNALFNFQIFYQAPVWFDMKVLTATTSCIGNQNRTLSLKG